MFKALNNVNIVIYNWFISHWTNLAFVYFFKYEAYWKIIRGTKKEANDNYQSRIKL